MSSHAIIFDLDGTLADSLEEISTAMNGALASFGLPTHPIDAYRLMVGEGAELLAQRALPTGSTVTPLQLANAYRSQYAVQHHTLARPYPGIADMLDALVARGIKLAVLSNKRDDFTRGLVEKHFSKWPFVDVRGERQGVPRKPDPTAALELALALNVIPSHIAFVGDTSIDMKTARAAGMKPIGVLWGFRGRAELDAAGAKHIIEAPAQLLPLVDGSRS